MDDQVTQNALREYINWCDQVIDYNFLVPRLVKTEPGGVYVVNGKISNVRRREEPSIRGFLEFLEATPSSRFSESAVDPLEETV